MAAASDLARARPQLVREAWRRGELSYKLRDYQAEVHVDVWRAILSPKVRKFCLNIARRWGKSFLLCLICVEFALRKKRARIRFAAPTADELRDIILPIMDTILEDCPEDLKPRWNTQSNTWVFGNKSRIKLAGVDTKRHANRLRGTGCDLAFIDEGGFIDFFNYLVSSVLMPQTLDTGGTLLVSSTPPESPAHEYVSTALECKRKGNYVHRDIFSANYDPETIASFAEEAGGLETTTFKREYRALFVRDETLAVIDEWNSQLFVRELGADPLRQFWHQYEALDIGESKADFQAVLFAHYNFSRAVIYVEDEFIDSRMPRKTTAQLAVEVKRKERELWADPAQPMLPVTIKLRIADNNDPKLLMDLAVKHDLPFWPTTKDSLASMVNKARQWVKSGRVIVHPRCVNLIACLDHGIWLDVNHINREFIRTPELGHLDALAALIYLIRNVDEATNPIPAGWGLDATRQHIPAHLLKPPLTPMAKTLQGAFARRRVN